MLSGLSWIVSSYTKRSGWGAATAGVSSTPAASRSGNDQVNIGTPGVTLTSYPGERATIRTLVWVEQTADGATVSDLDLDGRNQRGLPSPIDRKSVV